MINIGAIIVILMGLFARAIAGGIGTEDHKLDWADDLDSPVFEIIRPSRVFGIDRADCMIRRYDSNQLKFACEFVRDQRALKKIRPSSQFDIIEYVMSRVDRNRGESKLGTPRDMVLSYKNWVSDNAKRIDDELSFWILPAVVGRTNRAWTEIRESLIGFSGVEWEKFRIELSHADTESDADNLKFTKVEWGLVKGYSVVAKDKDIAFISRDAWGEWRFEVGGSFLWTNRLPACFSSDVLLAYAGKRPAAIVGCIGASKDANFVRIASECLIRQNETKELIPVLDKIIDGPTVKGDLGVLESPLISKSEILYYRKIAAGDFPSEKIKNSTPQSLLDEVKNMNMSDTVLFENTKGLWMTPGYISDESTWSYISEKYRREPSFAAQYRLFVSELKDACLGFENRQYSLSMAATGEAAVLKVGDARYHIRRDFLRRWRFAIPSQFFR